MSRTTLAGAASLIAAPALAIIAVVIWLALTIAPCAPKASKAEVI